MKASRLALVLCLGVGGAAHAHIGAIVAKADYLHPLGPTQIPLADGGVGWVYTPEEADASYHVSWMDGDTDPTARFTFWYLDHGVSDAVSADQIEATATMITTTDGSAAAGIFASCSCDPDAGVKCAVLPDGGVRACPNDFVWDTSQLKDGVYWIAAVNNDPPYHVYNLSLGPVRVAHSAKKPPIVIVVSPDGLGAADTSTDVQAIVVGTPPMTLALAYGQNDLMQVLGATNPIAAAMPVTLGADGVTHYAWDVHALADDNYFVRATLADANGSTSSDSHWGQAVYHALDAGTIDGGRVIIVPPAAPKGCGCALGANAQNSALDYFPAGVLAGLALISLRRARRGSRSA